MQPSFNLVAFPSVDQTKTKNAGPFDHFKQRPSSIRGITSPSMTAPTLSFPSFTSFLSFLSFQQSKPLPQATTKYNWTNSPEDVHPVFRRVPVAVIPAVLVNVV